MLCNRTLAQTLQWSNQISAINVNTHIELNKLSRNNAGDIFSIGLIADSANFNPTGTALPIVGQTSGGQDLFIQRLDGNGNNIWVKKIESANSFIQPVAIKTDNDYIYITGTFEDTVDMDPSANSFLLTPEGARDLFIVKFNLNGDFIWAKSIGGNLSSISVGALQFDNFGNILIGGSFNEIVDFDPNLTSQIKYTNGSYDAFILNLSNAGNFQWVETFVTTNQSMITSILVESFTNNIIVGGHFKGIIDLNPTAAMSNFVSKGNSFDIFFSKLTMSTNFINGVTTGGTGNEFIADAQLNIQNDIVFAVNFTGICDIDPSINTLNFSSNAGSSDALFVKYDKNLNLIWAKNIGGSGDDFIHTIAVDYYNNIYIAGQFSNTVDFNPSTNTNNLISSGGKDIFYAKYNFNGVYNKAVKIGNTGDDNCVSLLITDALDILLAGNYKQSIDVNPSPTVTTLQAINSVAGNIFYAAWQQCTPVVDYQYVSGCSATVNGITYNGNGTYLQSYTTAGACDSLIYIYVSGSNSNTTVNAAICGGTYSLNGSNYSNTGTYVQHYNSTNGCDSSITLNLNVSNTSSSVESVNACLYYIWHNQLFFNSGTYYDTTVNIFGCDSLNELHLTINQNFETHLYDTACTTFIYNGNSLLTSGDYQFNFLSLNGCDSVVYLHLSIEPEPNTILNLSSCKPILSNGQLYTASGTYNQNYSNMLGCDSTVILHINIQSINKTIVNTGTQLVSNQNLASTYQWIKCYPTTLIPDSTNNTFTPSAGGEYAVIVSTNGCTDTSNCIMFTPLQVETKDIYNEITISPNPTTGRIYLQSADAGHPITQIRLYALTGNKILEVSNISNKHVTIDFEHIETGIYLIEVTQGNRTMYKKLTKM